MERSRLEPPCVSVIIAVKMAAVYLVDCLESVAAQTFTDYEIIVVDGRSTDATEAIARSYAKVRFFQQTGQGFADAWNFGLRKARGDYITFIDSDDRWTPNKLAGQLAMLQGTPGLEAVIGKVRFFLKPGRFRRAVSGRRFWAETTWRRCRAR